MQMSRTVEKIQDWLALSQAEYCDKYGHEVSDWWETDEHVQHTFCDHCGQEMYKLKPHNYINGAHFQQETGRAEFME